MGVHWHRHPSLPSNKEYVPFCDEKTRAVSKDTSSVTSSNSVTSTSNALAVMDNSDELRSKTTPGTELHCIKFHPKRPNKAASLYVNSCVFLWINVLI